MISANGEPANCIKLALPHLQDHPELHRRSRRHPARLAVITLNWLRDIRGQETSPELQRSHPLTNAKGISSPPDTGYLISMATQRIGLIAGETRNPGSRETPDPLLLRHKLEVLGWARAIEPAQD